MKQREGEKSGLTSSKCVPEPKVSCPDKRLCEKEVIRDRRTPHRRINGPENSRDRGGGGRSSASQGVRQRYGGQDVIRTHGRQRGKETKRHRCQNPQLIANNLLRVTLFSTAAPLSPGAPNPPTLQSCSAQNPKNSSEHTSKTDICALET